MLISGIGGALDITLSTNAVALELCVSATKLGILCMEALVLESPPLGLTFPVPMEEVVPRASSRIGNPCQVKTSPLSVSLVHRELRIYLGRSDSVLLYWFLLDKYTIFSPLV